MRTFLSVLSVLLCGLLLTGAVGFNAPVMQSQSFYINDHAGVISRENRDNMLKTAKELYDKTGVRAVLLTIENLDGRTSGEYAEVIFNAWELGAGGTGILILLSTEEKRFTAWSNADITATYSIAAADQLAETGQFDLAASSCFFSVIDSIYSKYPSKETTESVVQESVSPESSVVSKHESQNAQSTPVTASTDSAQFAEMKKSVFYGVLFLFLIILLMNMLRAGSKRRRKSLKNESIYLRQVYSPDEPIAVREDDVDYPSGFGGLGNRKAIYLEDVDAADDIGIIKRNNYDSHIGKKQDNRES